jgi:hypothetical protein
MHSTFTARASHIELGIVLAANFGRRQVKVFRGVLILIWCVGGGLAIAAVMPPLGFLWFGFWWLICKKVFGFSSL